MKVRGILFDIDGTLVNITFDLARAKSEIIEMMANIGFNTDSIALSTPTQSILDNANKQIQSGKVRYDYYKLKKEIYSILDRYEIENADRTYALSDVKDTLEILKGRGVRLGIVTNSGRSASSLILAKNSLKDYFEFVVTRDDVEGMKPKPDGILKGVVLLSLPKEDVIYVGDSVYDVIAAHSAGIAVVTISKSWDERSNIERPDYIIGSIAKLIQVING